MKNENCPELAGSWNLLESLWTALDFGPLWTLASNLFMHAVDGGAHLRRAHIVGNKE